MRTTVLNKPSWTWGSQRQMSLLSRPIMIHILWSGAYITSNSKKATYLSIGFDLRPCAVCAKQLFQSIHSWTPLFIWQHQLNYAVNNFNTRPFFTNLHVEFVSFYSAKKHSKRSEFYGLKRSLDVNKLWWNNKKHDQHLHIYFGACDWQNK